MKLAISADEQLTALLDSASRPCRRAGASAYARENAPPMRFPTVPVLRVRARSGLAASRLRVDMASPRWL